MSSYYLPQFKENVNQSFLEVLEELKTDILLSINCVKLGTIEEFDPTTQTATVKISYKRILWTDYDGNQQLGDYPVLINVPCFVYTGNTESYISMPINKGDTCLVLFNDRDIDNWFFNGDDLPPNAERYHDIADGLCIVGWRNMNNKIEDYLADGIRIKFNTNTDIKIKDQLINILSGLIKIKSDIEITGNISILGNMVINGNLTVQGNITVSGSVIASGDVFAGGISLKSHVHGGVQPGSGTTGGPQ